MPKTWDRPAYFGHTPVDTYLPHADLLPDFGHPIRANKVTLVDTACFAPGGRLSAVCHETGQVLQIARDGTRLPDLHLKPQI